MCILAVCVFQGGGPFHLSYQICGLRFIYGIPLLPVEWPPDMNNIFIGNDPDAGKE